jgi:hypothetical protein
VSVKLWAVEFGSNKIRRQLEEISGEERGKEAVDAFMRFLQRSPEDGYACFRHDPIPKGRPFHTANTAYLGIYEIDERTQTVTVIGIRSIPYATAGYD